ncbi:MICAL-like protein 2 [Amia ocellicauda]|uniref:MICAL-like protein 2 n=1 Tax=Amia ocellicauda TaxID=2972642 RepID=UPI003464235E
MASSIKALQQWCKSQCEGYRDVAITNMTTSFRDGLAFCALLHRHRPELINFDSLSKENIYENNNLAFRVAEDKLGIPALLDADDMVALRVPDRLSILTYVSQYYNYFHGRSPIGGMAGIKRPAEESKEEPSGKKNLPVVAKAYPSKPSTETRPLSPPAASTQRPSPKPARAADKKVLVESSNKTGNFSSTCAMCKNHVHLVQRHLVDGKLYHRNCFKCKQCSNILLSGTYKPGPEPGTFICTTHQLNQSGTGGRNSSAVGSGGLFGGGVQKNSPVTAKMGSNFTSPKNEGSVTPRPASNTSVLSVNTKTADTNSTAKPWTPSAEKTQAAREKFFQSTPTTPSNPPSTRWSPQISTLERTSNTKSPLRPEDEKDKARSVLSKKLEGNTNNNNTSFLHVGLRTPDSQINKRFGAKSPAADSPSWKREDGSPASGGLRPVSSFESSPLTLNNTREPSWVKTGSKDMTNLNRSFSLHSPTAKSPSVITRETDNSASPADWRSKLKPVSKAASKVPDPQDKVPPASTPELTKKAAAPSRPSSSPASCVPASKPASTTTSVSVTISVPAAPGAGGRRVLSPPAGLVGPKSDLTTPGDVSKGSSAKDASVSEVKSPKAKQDYIPQEEILRELEEIEEHLNELEKKGVEMEKQLRSCEEEEGEEALMVDWFNLIRNKQVFMRRESELVYIAKTQDLEEQQPGVEGQLRRLMEKPEHLKTSADKVREKELMDKLVEIVNDRNAIVDGLDEDRLREEEEDQQLNEMMQKLDTKKGDKNKRKSPISKLFKWKN